MHLCTYETFQYFLLKSHARKSFIINIVQKIFNCILEDKYEINTPIKFEYKKMQIYNCNSNCVKTLKLKKN